MISDVEGVIEKENRKWVFLWLTSQLIMILTLVLLNLDLFFLENTVEPDQLASSLTKTSDQDPHCFPQCLKTHAYS